MRKPRLTHLRMTHGSASDVSSIRVTDMRATSRRSRVYFKNGIFSSKATVKQ